MHLPIVSERHPNELWIATSFINYRLRKGLTYKSVGPALTLHAAGWIGQQIPRISRSKLHPIPGIVISAYPEDLVVTCGITFTENSGDRLWVVIVALWAKQC